MRKKQLIAFYIWGFVGILFLFASQFYFTARTTKITNYPKLSNLKKVDFDDAEFLENEEEASDKTGNLLQLDTPENTLAPVVSTEDDTLVLELDQRESISEGGDEETVRATNTKGFETDESTRSGRLNVKDGTTEQVAYLLEKGHTFRSSRISAVSPGPYQGMEEKTGRGIKNKSQRTSSTKARHIPKRQERIQQKNNVINVSNSDADGKVKDQTTATVVHEPEEMSSTSIASLFIPTKDTKSSISNSKVKRKGEGKVREATDLNDVARTDAPEDRLVQGREPRKDGDVSPSVLKRLQTKTDSSLIDVAFTDTPEDRLVQGRELRQDGDVTPSAMKRLKTDSSLIDVTRTDAPQDHLVQVSDPNGPEGDTSPSVLKTLKTDSSLIDVTRTDASEDRLVQGREPQQDGDVTPSVMKRLKTDSSLIDVALTDLPRDRLEEGDEPQREEVGDISPSVLKKRKRDYLIGVTEDAREVDDRTTLTLVHKPKQMSSSSSIRPTKSVKSSTQSEKDRNSMIDGADINKVEIPDPQEDPHPQVELKKLNRQRKRKILAKQSDQSIIEDGRHVSSSVPKRRAVVYVRKENSTNSRKIKNGTGKGSINFKSALPALIATSPSSKSSSEDESTKFEVKSPLNQNLFQVLQL